MIVITEHITDVRELAKQVREYTGYDTRATILGHIQRGGRPSPFDRVLASRLGNGAVEEILKGEGAKCMGIFNNQIIATPMEEALQMKKNLFEGYRELTKKLS